jgi:hypothetical protein
MYCLPFLRHRYSNLARSRHSIKVIIRLILENFKFNTFVAYTRGPTVLADLIYLVISAQRDKLDFSFWPMELSRPFSSHQQISETSAESKFILRARSVCCVTDYTSCLIYARLTLPGYGLLTSLSQRAPRINSPMVLSVIVTSLLPRSVHRVVYTLCLT